MTITILYVGLLAILLLLLSIRVVRARLGPGKPSLGDGGYPRSSRRSKGAAGVVAR